MSPSAMEDVRNIVLSIQNTRDEEIGCVDCFAVLDQFMELLMEGKQAADLMPLVQDHLDRCGDCHEEFQALLSALRSAS